jgi:dipeptidyl aminopeptidase/acylaminoacyl peptidase
LDWDNPEKTFLVESYSSTEAPEFYVLSLEKQKLELVGYDNFEIKDRSFNETQSFSFRARDNSIIHGYLTVPDDKSKGPFPLLVDVHGGPWARDAYSFDRTAQSFSRNGFAYLKVNFRGSTGYGYRHFIEGKKNHGMTALGDIVDGVEAVIREHIADSSKIAIMGASYGGYAALMNVIKRPDLFRCGIDISGPADLTQQIRSYLPAYGTSFNYDFWEEMLGHEDELKLISPIQYCDRIDRPLLIIHGDADPVVSVKQSRDIVDRLKALGKPVEYLELENEGHGGWSRKSEELIHQRILRFLRANL